MSVGVAEGGMIRRKRGWFYFLPSLIGLSLFYLIPLLLSLSYALLDNMSSKKFVGLQHFAATLRNQMFQHGLRNTVTLLAVGMPLLFVLALAIALRVQAMPRGQGIVLALLLLPLIVPSGVTVHFWQSTFAVNGQLNRVLYDLNLPLLNFAGSRWAMLLPLLIYLWKNTGFAVLLLYTGLQRIPREYYEQAACSGASQGQQLRQVTWPYLAPTSLVVIILSFIGSLQVFKELYLLYGNYPPRQLYLLQHYLNNQFFSFNMQRLTAAAYILIIAVGLGASGLFLWQKKLSDTFVLLQLGYASTVAVPGSKRLPWGLIMLLVFTLLPLVLICSSSLMSSAEIAARYPVELTRGGEPAFIRMGLLPTEPTLQQYASLLSAHPAYWRSYGNSLAIALPVVVGQCVLSCFAAYAFHRSRWRHKELLFFGYIFLMLLPLQVLLLPHYLVADYLSLLDSRLAIILPGICGPFGTFWLRQQLKGFPQECLEAAATSGASEWELFRHIVLPNLKPALASLCLLTFAEYWNVIDQAVVLLKSPSKQPLSLQLGGMLSREPELFFAGACLYLLPVVLLFMAVLSVGSRVERRDKRWQN